MKYLTWNISTERQKHEWMRVRRIIVRLRLGFLIGGHALYFAVCGIAHRYGKLEAFGHSIGVGLWSLLLIGLLLLALEYIYAHLCPNTSPQYVIRNTGITLYGEDGPSEHIPWDAMRYVRIESDPLRQEFRSLILLSSARNSWVRSAMKVAIPLPEPETEVVRALGAAMMDNGLRWTAVGDLAILH